MIHTGATPKGLAFTPGSLCWRKTKIGTEVIGGGSDRTGSSTDLAGCSIPSGPSSHPAPRNRVRAGREHDPGLYSFSTPRGRVARPVTLKCHLEEPFRFSRMAGFTNFGLVVFLLIFTFLNVYVYFTKVPDETRAIHEWLAQHDLFHLRKLFKSQGISSLVSCATVEDLPELHPHDEERLQRAARLLQQRLILRQWLYDLGLHHHHHRLVQEDVTSLEDVYWLEDSRARFLLGKDFPTWSTARQALPVSKEDLNSLKAELWSAVVKNSHHQDAWTFRGMLVVSVSVAGLVTLAAMTQPSLAPEAKHSLLQYVTGKYLHTGNTTVQFHWEDPQQVGQSMSLTISFFQRNGQPYPICDTDRLVVDVSESEGHRRVATLVELGGTEPHSVNTAVVKFTVRHAGHYRISILIGNTHINGSPFLKTFLPGPPDPVKTTFVRPSSTVICTCGLPHSLALEPRDEFNNLCKFSEEENPTVGYTVSINPIGVPAEETDAAWSLEYDQNSGRIMLGMMLAKEGCFKIQVSYSGTTLSNGLFDCIVLSGNDAGLVQKNVRNHNTWYEAKLLSFQGERFLKPRKVLVYISPKQLTIKEFLLKFIPKRLITFRLCPSTKFHFLSENNQTSFGSFIIDDGCQPKVELMSRDRNVIAATFTHFLLKNIAFGFNVTRAQI